MDAASPGREVVRCRHCKLVQFVHGEKCLRCHGPLRADPESVPEPVCLLPRPAPLPLNRLWGAAAAAIYFWRHFNGLSQRALAARLNAQRTYISKVERGCSCPTLPSLLRFAEALEISPFMLAITVEAFMTPERKSDESETRQTRTEAPRQNFTVQ